MLRKIVTICFCFIVVLLVSVSLVGPSHAALASSPEYSVSVKPSDSREWTDCEHFINSYRPSWAPAGWAIHCASEIKMGKQELLGIASADQRAIYVSSVNAYQDLPWVVSHEWGHAADFTYLPQKAKEEELVRKSTTGKNVAESIADFQAYCAAKATSWDSVYKGVTCKEIKEVLAWVTINEMTWLVWNNVTDSFPVRFDLTGLGENANTFDEKRN